MIKVSRTRLIPLIAVAGLALASCASTAFPYKRFALQQDGTLLAAKAEDDAHMRQCLTQKGGSRCFVFFADEYEKMRRDYADAIRRLKKCGQACK